MNLYRIITALFLLSATCFANAACTLASIQGKYAAEALFLEDDDQWGASSAMMVRFDGKGRVTIVKAVEGSNGLVSTGTGRGDYNIQSNCTGSADLQFLIGGQVVARGQLDFMVGGTRNNQEIVGVYTNAIDGSTGGIRLFRSHL